MRIAFSKGARALGSAIQRFSIANAYDRHEYLDVYGRRVKTFRDFRLVRSLCRAYAYGRYLGVPMAPSAL